MATACADSACHDSTEFGDAQPSFESVGFTWFRLAIALTVAGQSMVLGLGYNNAMIAGEGPVYGSLVYWAIHAGLLSSALLVMVLLGGPLLRATLNMVSSRSIALEGLFSLSLLGALLGSIISSISGATSVYYEVVAVVLVVYTIGDQFGRYNRAKALQAVGKFDSLLGTARVWLPDGTTHTVATDQLQAGSDLIVVDADQPIPVDGRVVAGTAFVAETALTGEPAPVVKAPGDSVQAGSFVLDAPLRVLVLAASGNRLMDAIFAGVRTTGQHPSRWQKQADRLIRYFLPFVALVSLSTFLFWWLWPSADIWQALFNSMAVLLIACPCALGLATPIALWHGTHLLNRSGILCRNGLLLDALGDCDLVVFDKTGTLSEDSLQVKKIEIESAWRERQQWLLAAVAGVEQGWNHPVAKALRTLSHSPLSSAQRRILPGQGVSALVDGRSVCVRQLLDDRAGLAGGSDKNVVVTIDDEPAATLTLGEHLRLEVIDLISGLRRRGLRLRILTGDPAPGWQSIGGVTVESALSPLQKLRIVEEERANGATVLFVGDGLNDAAAMAAANGSIAMGNAFALARSTAQAVLFSNRLGSVAESIDLARHLRRRLRGNLIFAGCYNLTGIILAATGNLHPVVAALIMAISSFWVSWRAISGNHQFFIAGKLMPK